ncbi:hypothetical protein [Cupriavidus basilensis]
MPILLVVLALQGLVPGATSFAALARYDNARTAACARLDGLP